jgi:site-specific DNA-methyltransferase (adenine-specific)
MSDEFFKTTIKSHIEIRIDDCINLPEDFQYDSIITDPPYEIGLHKAAWDNTGIAFSPLLWNKLYKVLKPGGFIAACSSMRLYHRLATAAENAGFELYPFLIWNFEGGLPKPANLSELFDRDNIEEREIIGYKKGSGYTKANVDHGAQQRTHTEFPIYARHVSPEAQEWRDYYYGVNTIMPNTEPVLIAQKPIETKRMIDNIRKYRTGAMNIGALKEKYGSWPTNILHHKKARKTDHNSNHPSVKPVKLFEDLCMLLTPLGGKVLDPFAGTGTTGVACQNLGYDCVLYEQNIEMEDVIKKRL